MHALLRAEPPARRQWAVLAQRQQPQDRRPHLHSAIEGTHRAANVIGTDGIPGDLEAIDAPHPAAGNIDPVGPANSDAVLVDADALSVGRTNRLTVGLANHIPVGLADHIPVDPAHRRPHPDRPKQRGR